MTLIVINNAVVIFNAYLLAGSVLGNIIVTLSVTTIIQTTQLSSVLLLFIIIIIIIYSHIFPDSRAQHCNYATLLAGSRQYVSLMVFTQILKS